MEISKNKLKTENIKKLLFQMSIPAITAQIINLLYSMVDRMYIARIKDVGSLALTGVGVTMPIIILISAFAALASMGAAPRASIMLGQNKPKSAEKILGNAFSSLVIISIVLTIAIITYSTPILTIFGASPDTISYAKDYINIYALGTIFVQLALGLNAFISAQGQAKISMQTILIGAIINIILDPIFIFTFKMGVKGAALATIIAQATSAIYVLLFLFSSKSQIRLQFKYFKLEKDILLPSLLLGLSPFIMQVTESILAIVFNTSLLKYGGDLAIGTMTILTSVMQLSMLPLFGLTQGAQPILSYNCGAKDYNRVKETYRLVIIVALIYSTLLWLLIMLKPILFARIFTDDIQLIKMVIPSLRIFMAVSFMFSLQITTQQTFIALNKAKVSIFIALLRKVILLIPLIYIMPLILEDKVFAIFLAEPISDTISVIVTMSVAYISFKEILFVSNE